MRAEDYRDGNPDYSVDEAEEGDFNMLELFLMYTANVKKITNWLGAER